MITICLLTALNLDRVEIHGFTIGTARDQFNSMNEMKTIIAGVATYRTIIANRGFPLSANLTNTTTEYTTVKSIRQGSTIEQSTPRSFMHTINSIDSTPVSSKGNMIVNTGPSIATKTASTETSVETTGTRQTSLTYMKTSENNKVNGNGNSSQSSFLSTSLIIILLICYSM